MKTDYFDIAVVGSGFGGSLMALIARRLGRSVILIEREKHPRFAIGESSTPMANLLLEELTLRYDLPRLLPLTKWGSWQKSYPHLPCGLKRGFSFFHHDWDQPFQKRADRSNELLVAASPADDIADTHWFRADFDQFLMEEARSAGATYFDQTEIRSIQVAPSENILTLSQRGEAMSVKARLVLDATGPRGALHRLLTIGETSFDSMPETETVFSHFSKVPLFAATVAEGDEPPYPIDDAAVHHIFPGGWIWVLRFNNGITSAGAVARKDVATRLNFREGRAGWERLLRHLPSVEAVFASAKMERPFIYRDGLTFRSRRVAGPGWALLPSAAGFVDPLLSTGFPLTLLGVQRVAQILEESWSGDLGPALAEYDKVTLSELDLAALLVSALYATMENFQLFSRISLLYFAAVSFSETWRRLGRNSTGHKFLLGHDAGFIDTLKGCCDRALRSDHQGLCARIDGVIEPYNIAGLTSSVRRNWHPVEAADLFRNRAKLNATESEIESLLRRCGFKPSG